MALTPHAAPAEAESATSAPTRRGRLAQTPRTLVVLALLSERDMHPYEIQQRVRERCLTSMVKLTQGALYHAVDRLVEYQLIQPVETSRSGRRPERTVYAITEAGRDAVTLHLRELLATPATDGLVTTTALAVASLLPPAAVAEELDRRVVALGASVAAYREVVERLRASGLERVSVIEVEFATAMQEAELAWMRALRRDLGDGSLTWQARAGAAAHTPAADDGRGRHHAESGDGTPGDATHDDDKGNAG